jgi:hypothetical protein
MYMKVPGYVDRQTTTLAPPPEPMVVNAITIDPLFKESLFDWVVGQVGKAAKYLSEVTP